MLNSPINGGRLTDMMCHWLRTNGWLLCEWVLENIMIVIIMITIFGIVQVMVSGIISMDIVLLLRWFQVM